MKSVGELLGDRELYFLRPDWSVHKAAHYMAERKIGAVVVIEGERLVGIFSERDLMTRVVLPRRDIVQTKVAEVMTRDLVVASPRDSAEGCMQAMQRGGFRHLPIVDGGKLLGVLSLRELLQRDLEEKDGEVRAMTDYIRYAPQPGAD